MKTRMTVVVAAMASAVLMSLGVGDILAQTHQKPSEETSKNKDETMGGQTIDGRIRTVADKRITLDDGTVVVVPPETLKQSELKVGARVKGKYETRNGGKVAPSLGVNPAAESGARTGSGTNLVTEQDLRGVLRQMDHDKLTRKQWLTFV